jgi:hypothetical protein
MDNKKIYRIRLWYALEEHIFELGTADEIIQTVFGEDYPCYITEVKMWKKSNTMYQLTINFKEMTVTTVMIADDGEHIIPNSKEVFDDRFWTIDWDEEIEEKFNLSNNV